MRYVEYEILPINGIILKKSKSCELGEKVEVKC